MDAAPQTWSGVAVHMALLPDSGVIFPSSPYTARILWWYGLGHSELYGGEWRWKPGEYNCGSYPSTKLTSFTFPFPDANAGVFCGSNCHLASDAAGQFGRLLVAGGTQQGTENGARHAHEFDVLANTWTTVDSMGVGLAFPHGARWYADGVVMPSGKVVVTSGHEYQQILLWGGRIGTDVTPADSAIVPYGLSHHGVADDPIRTSSTALWPSPREGHTAVSFGIQSHLFGGKDRYGYSNEYWQLARADSSFDADYDYAWHPQSMHGAPPDPRWEHTAIATGDVQAPMIIYGGMAKAQNQTDDVVMDDVWRMYFDPQQGNTWAQIEVDTSAGWPGPRWGHAAIYHAPSRRMFMFGGRSTTSGAPTDDSLWTLTFDEQFETAAWAKLSAVGPSARFDHAFAYDPRWHVYDAQHQPTDTTVALLFGGDLGNSKSNELWQLQVTPAPAWRKLTLEGDAPTARSGHTITADGGAHLLYVFGGKSTDDTVYAAHVDPLSAADGEQRTWLPFARNSVALSNHAVLREPLTIFNRVPEIFDPTASPGSQWTRLSSAVHMQDLYPQGFTLNADTVFYAGPDTLSYIFKPSAPSWTAFPTASTGFKGGSAVMYRPGKVMKCGSRDSDLWEQPAIGKTVHIDLNLGSSATWDTSANRMVPRVNHNLLLLPTGKVMVVGGTGWIDNGTGLDSVMTPEIWDPDYNGG